MEVCFKLHIPEFTFTPFLGFFDVLSVDANSGETSWQPVVDKLPSESKKREEKKREEVDAQPTAHQPSPSRKRKTHFDLFWKKYPNKKSGPSHAFKSWEKYKSEMTIGFTMDILRSVDRHIETEDWKKDGGKYIPLATTWLNQRRWEAVFDSSTGTGTEHDLPTTEEGLRDENGELI